MGAIKSLLTEVVKNLPENSMKAQSVVPALMKKGVKAEELEFAAMELPKAGKVSKQEIVEAEAKRKDKFYTTETKGFQNISLPAGKNNPTYKMKVLSFNEQGVEKVKTGEHTVPVDAAPVALSEEQAAKLRDYVEMDASGEFDEEIDEVAAGVLLDFGFDGDQHDHLTYAQSLLRGENPSRLDLVDDIEAAGQRGQTSRYTSSHTDVPDYLAHTRIYDEDWDGQPVRVLQEIQSDLHQAGRQQGYDSNPQAIKQELADQAGLDVDELDAMNLEDLQSKLGEDAGQQFWDLEEGTGVPKSPQEKTWLRKGIERELMDGIEEGRTQLAIPISGADIGDLARAPGVQKWYETQVANTAKKVAKASGSDFEMVTKGNTTYATIKPKGTFVEDTGSELPAKDAQAFGLTAREQQLVSDGHGVQQALNDPEEAMEQFGVTAEQLRAEYDSLAERSGIDPENMDFMSQEEILTAIDEDGLLGAIPPVDKFNVGPKGKLDLDKPFSFSLYSSPAAAAGVAYMAYQQGASEQQVTEALESKGFGMDDVQTQLEFLTQAIDQGASVQEAVKYLESKDVKATTVEKKPPPVNPTYYGSPGYGGAAPVDTDYQYGGANTPRAAYDAIIRAQQNMTDEEVLSALMTIYPVMSSLTTTDIPSMVGNEAAKQRYDMARQSSRLRIQTLFKDKTGKELFWDQGDGPMSEGFYLQDEQGEYTEITPGFLNSLADDKFEILGSITGGTLGYFTPTPGAAYVGTLAGSVTGAEVDYFTAAMRLQLDMDAESAAWTALNSGEMAIIGEAIAYPVVKGLGYAWKGTSKAVTNALSGDSTGAAKALKETTFLNQDQVDEIVNQVKRYTPLKGTKSEQSIQAVTMTQPGMEHVVAASQKYGDAGAQLTETIKRRTKDILAATADLTDENAPRMLGADLQNYVSDVKQSYNNVKVRATEAPDAANFSYDFKQLAIQPILEDTADKIFDPTVRDKFLNQMQRVNKLTDTEGFGNLIELRQLVNDFLYNSKITKADDKKLLRGALGEIDAAITDGAKDVVENPQQWLDDWAAVRADYSQMKAIEKSAMYKAIMDKNGDMRAFSPDQVVKRLTKYITALDGSFEAVISQLPIEGRKMYEGAIINSLTNKYTMDDTAIHFPQLAKDLAQVNFTTPENRAMKKVLTDLGETFKNDVKIVNASTGMHIPSVMQGLSDNLLVKAKYEIASNTYAKLRSVVQPSARHRVDLLQKVGALIEAPLNQKAAKDLLEAADGDVNLAKNIRELQQEAARTKAAGQDTVSPKLKFYGSGSVKRTKGEGAVTARIPAHRIATIEKARVIAESEYLTLDSKSLDAVLKQHGYEAIMQGSDSIRTLK